MGLFVRIFGFMTLGAFSLAACRADDAPAFRTDGKGDPVDAPSPPAITSSSSTPSAVPPPQVPEVEYSIVWGRAGGPAESFLLEWRPPALKVLGKRTGALIFASGGVYGWKETVGKAETLIDCDEAWNPQRVQVRARRSALTVAGGVVRLAGYKKTEASSATRTGGRGDMTSTINPSSYAAST